MSEPEKKNETEDAPMHSREITLSDGRYMIFYTFGDDDTTDEIEQREDV